MFITSGRFVRRVSSDPVLPSGSGDSENCSHSLTALNTNKLRSRKLLLSTHLRLGVRGLFSKFLIKIKVKRTLIFPKWASQSKVI
jgi:hypothetical protein